MVPDARDDTIIVGEAGSPDAAVWQESVTSLGNDLLQLRAFAEARLIEIQETADWVEIRGRDKVGTLLLDSGRRIIVTTKIPGIRLLEWLSYVGDFPDLTVWTQRRSVEAGGLLHKCLAELFLDELDILTRVHLRKGFEPLELESPNVRGQLQVSRLSKQPWRLPRLPQIVRSRTLDIDFNIVLALALDKIAPHQSDFSRHHRKTFAHLRDLWSAITRVTPDLVSIVNAVQAAPPHGYRRALQIARLILLGASLDPHFGTGGRVFTISLASVWERGLEKMFVELQGDTDWRVVPAKQRVRAWDDSLGDQNSHRWMLADLILQRGVDRAVLDAKYKHDFGGESRNDRFQISAYAIAFDSEQVALVYPQNSPNELRQLLTTTFGNRNVTVLSFTMPMHHGPEECKSRILQFTSHLSSQIASWKN